VVVLLPEVADDENIENENANFHGRQTMKQFVYFQWNKSTESIHGHGDGPRSGYPETDALRADNEAVEQASDAGKGDLIRVDLA